MLEVAFDSIHLSQAPQIRPRHALPAHLADPHRQARRRGRHDRDAEEDGDLMHAVELHPRQKPSTGSTADLTWTPAFAGMTVRLSGPGARGGRERLADRAEVAAAGLHRVAAAAQQRLMVAGLGRGRLGRVEARARPRRSVPRKYCAATRPRDRTRGSSSSASCAIRPKHLWSSAVAASATGAGVGAAARTTAMSTLSMPLLVNGKGGREVASIG